ncbi:MAG: hypothetical protein UU03_C0020G0008 [Candidatus Woesebacteria bacterium GW2011_GWA1_40_45]|uniref:Copper-sensing transcriptional repressor CsoR n=1 Tax=Candidatus Woesebacteria bacterium GW2011_GWA1_40_45 TaxID=1618554 RepID=A0A0G0UTC3_9BACT|nr:MAG: hypothetical protein UU03_C0020G0008 [Candidatus Woesebacteria bacterium GW2011_GWA1_40_45]
MTNKLDNNQFKKEALNRVRIAEGHLKKVESMLSGGAYCLDVIHQSRAVQAALKKVDEVVLHGHLHSCVLKDMHGSRSQNEEMVSEIVDLFSKKA